MASAHGALSPLSVTLRIAAGKGPALQRCSPQHQPTVVGTGGVISPHLPRRDRVPASSSFAVGESCIPLVWGVRGGQKGERKRMAELQGLSGDGGV